MWKKFNKYFNDYCEHSSIIGCNYVAEKRSKTERFLWITLIAIAIALSIYFIMEQYYKYDENPFIVSFATRERPIYTIPFPAITICPFTKADKSIFNYTDVIHRLWDKKPISNFEMQTTQYMTLLCDGDNDVDDIEDLLLENDTFTNHYYDRLDEIDTLEKLVEEFNCDFMGDFEDSFDCNEIFTPIILDGGICYTFNMLNREEIFRPKVYQYNHSHQVKWEPKSSWSVDDGYSADSGKFAYPRRALQSGADNALQVTLFARVQDNDYICNSDIGYSISVHLPSTIPQTKKDFFILPLDTNSQIILQPNLVTTSSTVKKYKIEDRQCFFSDERNLEYFVTYTQENCFLECLTNYTLQKCGCVNFFMPRENTTSICGNSRKDCLANAESEIKLVEINALLGKGKESSCNCLPLCNQLKYQANTSRYPWKWKELFRAHKKLRELMEYNETYIQKVHYSSLKIFFSSDQFLPSEKNELYGMFDFISNFGGLLGLFTGFSLLTAAEIVYYISIRLWCNKKLYNDISGPPEED
ncbi:unnamed protein product [Diabrotica balteata]|uniref:Uncharacterized protein n=1 Tax=Diabrotica balteata TaxID=107213 RepID=A0A9P0GYX4_DIABA|nr:unnamed protein product [Diabrotica balteata]